jgi:hypothetical protein
MNTMSFFQRINLGRLALTILAAVYLFSCLARPDFSHIIDNLDLIIHEAGHWIFMVFGDLVYTLGGSLNQVLVPALFVGYFLLCREWFAMSLMATWVGYNIVMVSWYMNDAIVMRLPLLGGEGVIHDWNHIFVMTNLLSHTYQIAHAFWGLGMLVTIAGFAGCLWWSLNKKMKLPVTGEV